MPACFYYHSTYYSCGSPMHRHDTQTHVHDFTGCVITRSKNSTSALIHRYISQGPRTRPNWISFGIELTSPR